MSPLLLLLACKGKDPPPDDDSETTTDSGTTDPGTDTATSIPRPTLSSPAEAKDLDPADDIVHIELTAAPASFEIGGQKVDGYAYNGQVPGPTIRAKRGDTLIVDLQNDLDTDTTIHWHGVHVPWAMDGVTWMSEPVAAGASFRYEYTLDQSGTYWYHPHFDTEQQVDLGLYGVLIVEEPDEPAADEELVVVFDSWAEAGDMDHFHLEGTHLTWTTNGLVEPVFQPEAGRSVRLRALNASNTGYVRLAWDGMRQIASDQGLLPELSEPDDVVLSPGDRADFEVLVGPDPIEIRAEPHSLQGGATYGEATPLFDIEATTADAPPSPLGWPFSGAKPSADPPHTDIVYTFQGDAATGTWLMNGEVFPDVTIESVDLDDTAIIEVRNVSPSEHPFHLHGHAFEVLSLGGVPPETQTIEDTINIPIQSWARLRLVADNPGDWMAHCHILPHAEDGMMTVLRVE